VPATKSTLNIVLPIYVENDPTDIISDVLRQCTVPRPLTADLIENGYVDGCSGETSSDFVIVDRSHHPYNIPCMYDQEFKFQAPTVALTGLYRFASDQPYWITFETYFALAACLPRWWTDLYSFKFDQEVRTYKFSCLNRTPKFERVWFYTQLHQQEFYKDSCTSFYKSRPGLGDMPLEYFRGNEGGCYPNSSYCTLDADTVAYFEKHIYPTLPHCTEQEKINLEIDSGGFTLDVLHPAFSDSYINIISEHLYQVPFLSEKTVKPLAAEQLFLMAGPVGAVQHVEELGFDVFRDVIDHDYYDHEPDWQVRLTKMLAVAADLYKQDIPAIWAATKFRRQQNRAYITSDRFRRKVLEPLTTWIDREFK
jgi:hypothetical protein